MWGRSRQRDVDARDDDRTDEPRETHDVEVRPARTFSPAQIVSLIVGGGAIALGVAALLDTGIHGDWLRTPQEKVWSFWHSPLLTVAEIAFGVILVVASLRAAASRTLMVLLGGVSAAFGLLILLDAWPRRLHRWFGVTDRNGWLFVIAGGVILLAGLLLPTIHRPEREIHHHRVHTGTAARA